jgi:hypothetical protein
MFAKPIARKGALSSMAEETKRVEAQVERLRQESSRLRSFAESMGWVSRVSSSTPLHPLLFVTTTPSPPPPHPTTPLSLSSFSQDR